MSEHGSQFNQCLKRLVGKHVEIRLMNEKTIRGKLLAVEKNLDLSLSTVEGSFFIHGDYVMAIKKEVER